VITLKYKIMCNTKKNTSNNKRFANLGISIVSNRTDTRHPKCKGYEIPDIGWGVEYDCEYNTKIDCDECKHGGGMKDPSAKCNQLL
jgi:hypothetical protein